MAHQNDTPLKYKQTKVVAMKQRREIMLSSFSGVTKSEPNYTLKTDTSVFCCTLTQPTRESKKPTDIKLIWSNIQRSLQKNSWKNTGTHLIVWCLYTAEDYNQLESFLYCNCFLMYLLSFFYICSLFSNTSPVLKESKMKVTAPDTIIMKTAAFIFTLMSDVPSIIPQSFGSWLPGSIFVIY